VRRPPGLIATTMPGRPQKFAALLPQNYNTHKTCLPLLRHTLLTLPSPATPPRFIQYIDGPPALHLPAAPLLPRDLLPRDCSAGDICFCYVSCIARYYNEIRKMIGEIHGSST